MKPQRKDPYSVAAARSLCTRLAVPTAIARFALVAVVALVAGQSACEQQPADGPPQLRLGRDECAECGMSIVEARSAAATIAIIDGQRSELLWDDIGCMLDWERERPDTPVTARYVRDFDTEAWVNAQAAHFVMSPKIKTPMASGLVAYTSADAAKACHAAHGGALLSWADLGQARTAWLRSQGRLRSP